MKNVITGLFLSVVLSLGVCSVFWYMMDESETQQYQPLPPPKAVKSDTLVKILESKPPEPPVELTEMRAQLDVYRIRLERAERTARKLQDELTTIRGKEVTVPKNLPASPDEEFYLNLAKKSAVDNAELANETWRRLMSVERLLQWVYGVEIDPWGGMRKMEVKPEWPDRLRPSNQDK